MNIYHRVIAGFVIAILPCSLAMLAWAQPPAPKAAKADRPAAEKAAAERPAKKQAVNKPDADAIVKEAPADSPAVAAVLETKPATPLECLRAARVLVDLGRPDLAKGLLKKVADAKLEPQQLVDLSGQIGSGVFLDLAAQPALMPEGRQLADAVVAALNAKLGDPERIAGLIRQLQDPSVDKRAEAMVELQESQGAAVGPLLAVLADPARAAEQANVRTVLAEMGRPARAPLVGILEGANPKLVVQAILTLAEMNNPKVELALLSPCLAANSDAEVRTAAAAALKRLTGRVPTKPQAIRLLTDAAKAYFDRHQLVEGVVDDKVELWRWDEAKQQCVAKTYTAEDAARAMAVRWAHDAALLAPDDGEIQLLATATTLEAAAYEKGLDRPLDDKDPAVVAAKKLGAKPLDGVLEYGIAHGHPAVATATARLLGQLGKAEDVLHQGDKPAPLALALRQPDRRLRMAALEAIVRLRPSKPFAGAGSVPGALQFFVASSGVRHALAASPNADETRDLAGLLAEAGYQCDTALNGRDLLRLAAQSPDYELALIDVTIDRPEIAMLLQQLRHDERTASLRVGLIARAGYLERAERLAQQDPLAMAFSRPHDKASLQWQLAQLATLAPREFVGFETRQRQAAQALDLWAELNRSPNRLYDLRRVQDAALTALASPKLALKAAAVLADVNSAESQKALVEVASRFTQPLDLRIAAAQAFRQNSEKHGILLTTREIRTQYGRYNESEYLDAPTQHVLGLILDCIEAPTARGLSVRDSGFSTPSRSAEKAPVAEPPPLLPAP